MEEDLPAISKGRVLSYANGLAREREREYLGFP